MKGYLVLHGGEAFSAENKPLDRVWLRLVRRAHTHPRVVVIPVAAVENPGKVGQVAASYFKHLGAFAEYTLITDSLSANTGEFCDMLDKVEAICLADGSPVHVVGRLRSTKTEAALRRALFERQGCVVAVGAGAMALGAVYWLGSVWQPGLALASRLAILPRHNLAQMRFSPQRLLNDLPSDLTLIGIDELTAAICHPDGTCQVEGQGEVTVYCSAEQQDSYQAGQKFALPPD